MAIGDGILAIGDRRWVRGERLEAIGDRILAIGDRQLVRGER